MFKSEISSEHDDLQGRYCEQDFILLYAQCMFFEWFGGKLFENGKRYTKSETTIQKALKERIPNHIQHTGIQFKRKISVSQSNLLYPLYVYNYLKRQKMPKRVKIFTSKWHRKQQHLLIHPFRSLQCIRFVEKNSFLSWTSLPEPILCEERGGVEFSTMPPSGPSWNFD